MKASLDQTALKLGNVFWLLAAMGLVIAPHVERLPFWVTSLCLLAALWRGVIAWKGMRTPHWMLMAAFAFGGAAGTYLSYDRLYGRDASSTLLIIMLCLKLLEMKSRRDALLTIFLGFFLIFTNFLYSQTIGMGAYMLGCVWLFVATLIGFNRVGSEASLRERLAPAGRLMLQAIPLTLVLFVLFPRLSTPLWRLPQDAHAGRTGLSDSVAPGDFNKLIQSESVAFRADFKGPIPRNSELYWRGPVMWDFDGRAWSMFRFSSILPPSRNGIEPIGRTVDYTVTMEPHGKDWVFALDMPQTLPDATYLYSDYQIRSGTPITSLKRYEMRSVLSYRAGLSLSPGMQRRFTRLPEGTNPRATAYAATLRERFTDDRDVIAAVQRLYNREFIYTLEPPRLGRHAVDEFMFETKRGFCEHYASAFVFLMRSAGIPARVVLGYQGGEINPVGNYLIVRQADAHAWAEVWLEGEGWVRTDPTGAVSPDRIERGMDLSMGPLGIIPNLIAADQFGILRQLRFGWDTFNNQWNQWVIGYNTERQQFILRQFGLEAGDWRKLALWLLIGSGVAGGAVALALLWNLRGKRMDPVQAAYELFSRRLARVGLERKPDEGPLDYLARITAARPELEQRAGEIIQLYIALRYAGDETAQQIRRLRGLAKHFRAA